MMAKYTKRFTGHIDCEIVTGRKHDGNNICNGNFLYTFDSFLIIIKR